MFDVSIAMVEWIYSRDHEKHWRKTSGMWAPVGTNWHIGIVRNKGCQSESWLNPLQILSYCPYKCFVN
jgi:hypothetical protein